MSEFFKENSPEEVFGPMEDVLPTPVVKPQPPSHPAPISPSPSPTPRPTFSPENPCSKPNCYDCRPELCKDIFCSKCTITSSSSVTRRKAAIGILGTLGVGAVAMFGLSELVSKPITRPTPTPIKPTITPSVFVAASPMPLRPPESKPAATREPTPTPKKVEPTIVPTTVPTVTPTILSIELAKEIMRDNFLGPEAVKNTWGIDLGTSIEPIHFDTRQLEQAKKMDHFLILRHSQNQAGGPLTINSMIRQLQPKYDQNKQGKILNPSQWPLEDAMASKEVAPSRWALVSKGIMPRTENTNYAHQTYLLADYLNLFYPEGKLPQVYSEALSEFSSNKASMERNLHRYFDGSGVAATVPLQLNQLLRPSPVELMYDLLVYHKMKDTKLLANHFAWTKGVLNGVHISFMGKFGLDGIQCYNWFPSERGSDLGLMISRTT